MRRVHDHRFATRYFVGTGIDIGAGPDPLSLYIELFPRIDDIISWDMPNGDAQFMAGVADASFDFVHSSHCLEHLVDPVQGLANWLRIVKPGGHLIVTVPDEDLYEQGMIPSRNPDHKWTFTIFKPRSWSPASINLTEFLPRLGPQAEIVKIELLDAGFRYRMPAFDQTATPIGESAIEFIIRKRTDVEADRGGRLPVPGSPSAHDLFLLTGKQP